MSKRIELTLQKDYIDWNLAESVRELAQNGIDAEKDGHPFTMKFIANDAVLRLKTEGIVLKPQTLLVGFTSKRDRDDLIGKFGEGYKLALLALVRLGHQVIIRTGTERWIPTIEPSEAFGGEKVLVINVEEGLDHIPNLEISIQGVWTSDWEEIQTHFLFLDPPSPEKILSGWNGSEILLEEKYQGRIYVGGIFVEKIEKYRYGYNFLPNQIALDRDRRMVNAYTLADLTSLSWGQRKYENEREKDLFWNLLITNAMDIRNAGPSWSHDRSIGKEMALRFQLLYGDKSIPVEYAEEATKLASYGFQGVVVPNALCDMIGNYLPTFRHVVNDMQNIVEEYIAFENLSETEKTNLKWAFGLLIGEYASIKGVTHIAKLRMPNISGFQVNSQITLNRDILENRKLLLRVLIHELAHLLSGATDGTVEHADSIQELWSNLSFPLLQGLSHAA